MKIHNLEINILYCLCDPIHGGHEDQSKAVADIVDTFSDIPVEQLMSTIRNMTGDGLITIDRYGNRLTITDAGINQLQSTIACRIHRFDRCRCGRVP
jgi:hypothetical protein